MKYVKIENAGSLDRRKIEIIGFGDKRESDDPAKHGYFGSGLKLAPIAAMRLGLKPTIASHDATGSYFLRFRTAAYELDGAKDHEVILDYWNVELGQTEPKRYSVRTLRSASGFMNWDKPIGADVMKSYRPLREIACNAMDAGQATFEHADVETYASPGKVTVQLVRTAELDTMLFSRRRNRYFKFLAPQRQLLNRSDIGSIYSRSDRKRTRFFVRGALAGCYANEQCPSAFDYSLNGRGLLSEEREIKDFLSFVRVASIMFAELTNVAIIRRMLRSAIASPKSFEAYVLAYWVGDMTTESMAAWLEAAHDVLGERVALASDNVQYNEDCGQVYRYEPVLKGARALHRFFAELGIPRVENIVGFEDAELDLRTLDDFDAGSRLRFRMAFDLFAARYPDRCSYPIGFFVAKGERPAALDGRAMLSPTFGWFYLIKAEAEGRLPPVEKLIPTMVHETRHCHWGASDYDRLNMQKADNDSVMEIMRAIGADRYEDGTPVVPASVRGAVEPDLLDRDELELVMRERRKARAAGGKPTTID